VKTMKALQVGDVMSRKVITASPQDTIVRAAREMYERKIESLPVVDEEELVGIVTSSDVMRALVSLSGASEPGHSRVAVQARKLGVLADAASIIRDQGVDVFSVLSSPQKRSVYDRTLIFQVAAKDPSWVIQNLQTGGYEASRWAARS
jgi:acetoin utilization protein AcuB